MLNSLQPCFQGLFPIVVRPSLLLSFCICLYVIHMVEFCVSRVLHFVSRVLQAMGIRRYIFMSIFNCDKHPEVPLMNIKAATEEFLKSSSLPHTTLRLCGFHQVRWVGAVRGAERFWWIAKG